MAFPLPGLHISRCMPLAVSQPIFDIVKIEAFSLHCRLLSRLRKKHGYPPFGNDLRMAYTDPDYTLYADAPMMHPIDRLPPHHSFLGLIPWSSPVSTPNWWPDLPTDKPFAYLTSGSSDSTKVNRMVIDAVAQLRADVLLDIAVEKNRT